MGAGGNQDSWGLALAVFAVVIWGGTPAATRIAVTAADGLAVGAFRTLVAAAIMVPAVLLWRMAPPRDRRGWAWLLVSGVCGFAAFNLLFSIAVARTSATHASLIIGAGPLFLGAVASVAERCWPRRQWWGGCAVGFAGVALLILWRDGGERVATVAGDLLCLLAMLLAGIGYYAGGNLVGRIGAWPAFSWGVIVGALVLLPGIFWFAGRVDWRGFSADGLWAFGYLVIGALVLGYTAWFAALHRAGVGRIAPVQFAQPLLGVLFAVLLLDEKLTLPIVLSSVIILAGIGLARRAAAVR